MSGLGPPKATIGGVGGPNLDGVSVSAIRADPRSIVLTLAIPVGTVAQEETAKQKIYDYFPIKQEVILGIETDAQDVYITAIVESNEFNQFAKVENAVITLYCPNPWFLHSTEETDLAVSSPEVIVYDGDISTGILIVVSIDDTGTIGSLLTITNTHSGVTQTMQIALTDAWSYFASQGVTERNNDEITIDTRLGQKSVIYRRDSGLFTLAYDLLNGVGIDDDWILFHPGSNSFGWYNITGDQYHTVDVTHRPQRQGV
jgi:hypothetical protein